MLSEAGRAFKKEVGIHIIREQMRRGVAWRYTDGGRLAVKMALYFPNQRRRDLDNTIKVTLDSLAEPLGFDDCCVDVLHVERKENDKVNPRCEITLEVLNG